MSENVHQALSGLRVMTPCVHARRLQEMVGPCPALLPLAASGKPPRIIAEKVE